MGVVVSTEDRIMLVEGELVRMPDGSVWRVLSVDNMGATVKTVRGHGVECTIGDVTFERSRTMLISNESVLERGETNE